MLSQQGGYTYIQNPYYTLILTLLSKKCKQVFALAIGNYLIQVLLIIIYK